MRPPRGRLRAAAVARPALACAWLAGAAGAAVCGVRDIAVGAAIGAPALGDVAVFARSFRHFAGPCAELVVFVSPRPPPGLLELLVGLGAVAVPVAPRFPWIRPDLAQPEPIPQLPRARLGCGHGDRTARPLAYLGWSS